LIEAFDEVLDLSVAVPLSVLACNHHSGLAAAAAGAEAALLPMPTFFTGHLTFVCLVALVPYEHKDGFGAFDA